MTTTTLAPNASIPAAIDGEAYVWADGGLLANVILARVDSKLANGKYVYQYAPVSSHFSGVDASSAFWDFWGEVEVYSAS